MDAVPELGTFFIFARVTADFTVYRNSVPDLSVLAIWILTSVWVLVLVLLYTKGHKLYSQGNLGWYYYSVLLRLNRDETSQYVKGRTSELTVGLVNICTWSRYRYGAVPGYLGTTSPRRDTVVPSYRYLANFAAWTTCLSCSRSLTWASSARTGTW